MSEPTGKRIGELEAILEIALIRKLKTQREIVLAFQDDVTDEELEKALDTATYFEIRCVWPE